jgi:hypothetical protein
LRLERPSGRVTLLDPEARRIAIGPALPSGGAPAIGAIITTYTLFENDSNAREQAQMVARVTAERKALGLHALPPLDAHAELGQQAQLILRGQREPYEALDRAMSAVVERTGAGVEGFTVEANEIERAPIPDAVLHMAEGSLAIEVTHHRVKGAAWGQYVVLYILAARGAEQKGYSL